MKSKILSLDRNILTLGANSFFTDFSTEMILPLLPIFMDKFLHASKSEIGFIEGLAEFGVAMLIALSGFYSDRIGKRKGITVFGYGLSNLIKPLAFFASSTVMIAMVRVGDRIGKGIRSAPRDALISQSTPKNMSGFVFGLHKMMDGAGALAGSFVAFIVLWYLGSSESTFRMIFLLSVIPGIISMAILIFLLSDKPFIPSKEKLFRPSQLSYKFYLIVLFQGLFSLVAMNYSFMILKAKDNGMALAIIPLAYALYNFCISFFAIPIGNISDRVGKPTLLSVVYFAFGLSAFFINTKIAYATWIAFAIYGFFGGGFNSLAKAIISDLTPVNLKATAYGVYYSFVGICTFLSLYFAGFIWDNFSSTILFDIVAVGSILLASLLFLNRKIWQ
ncbi:MAG: MFS transporter [Sulfurovaceae bacterium]|nr:MFS transporter [Sulfurovaceae bacterium]MDD5549317.1 MFS transporter [Sulfurovaceae bacterium]